MVSLGLPKLLEIRRFIVGHGKGDLVGVIGIRKIGVVLPTGIVGIRIGVIT